MKFHQILIEIHQNLNFLGFSLVLSRISTLSFQKSKSSQICVVKFFEYIFQKYTSLLRWEKLFHIFWMRGYEKIHCLSVYVWFEISSQSHWNPSKSQISCFFIKFEQNFTTFISKIEIIATVCRKIFSNIFLRSIHH